MQLGHHASLLQLSADRWCLQPAGAHLHKSWPCLCLLLLAVCASRTTGRLELPCSPLAGLCLIVPNVARGEFHKLLGATQVWLCWVRFEITAAWSGPVVPPAMPLAFPILDACVSRQTPQQKSSQGLGVGKERRRNTPGHTENILE